MTNDPSNRSVPSVSDAFQTELAQRFRAIGETIAQSLEREREAQRNRFERIRSIAGTAGFPPPPEFPVSKRQSLLDRASQAQQCGRAAERMIVEFGGVDEAFAAVEQAVSPSRLR